MSDVAKVSVIIPTYNCARFLDESVQSVFGQRFRDFTLVVVNDGSTDNTEDVLRPYRDRLVYVTQPNRGLPAALNAGIQAAPSELVAILDADDVWHPEKLDEQVALLSAEPALGACYTNFTPFGAPTDYRTGFDENRGQLVRYPRRQVGPGHYVITSPSLLHDFLVVQGLPKPSTLMVRRRCLDTVGPFDETLTFCQDTHMSLRLAKHFGFGYVDRCLVDRRIRSDSLASSQRDHRYVLEHVHMLETLERWVSLAAAERRAARRLLAKYRFSAGYLDFAELRLTSARRHLWRSLLTAPAAMPLRYALLACLPVAVVRRLKRLTPGGRRDRRDGAATPRPREHAL